MTAFTIAPAALASEIAWQRRSSNGNEQCTRQRAAALTCGSFGSYSFADPLAPPPGAGASEDTCGVGASGTEEPRVLVQEAVTAPASPWVPCAGGSCFDAQPSGDWVAVVDWNDLHGQSVAETILQASGRSVAVAFFDLESWQPDLVGDDLRAASDLQVLAQLCRVVERAEETTAPLVVNMSFGREWTHGIDPCASGDSLVCEVHNVLAHLRSLGAAAVAAAGNHQQLLYPAADRNVIAVGGLDLARFARTGGAFISGLTSPSAEMVLPAHGLVLEEPAGEELWALPPGSSYASALAAGWLAAYRRQQPTGSAFLSQADFGWNGIELWPERSGGGYALRYRGQPLAGSAQAGAGGLLDTALGLRPEIYAALDAAASSDGERSCALVVQPVTLSRNIKSLPQIIATSNRPSPDSEPCVPCRLRRPGRARAAQRAACAVVPDFVVELGRSAGTSGDADLVGLYLTIGTGVAATHLVVQVGLGEDPSPPLAAGAIKEYQIVLASDEDRARLLDEPVMLRYIMRRPGESETYWDATPLTVHLPEIHQVFSDGFEGGTAAWAGALGQ